MEYVEMDGHRTGSIWATCGCVVHAASKQPTEPSEETAISDSGIAYQRLCMAVSKWVSFRKRFKTFRNSKMLLRSGTFGTFRNIRRPVLNDPMFL